jgi:hypothetical protein
MEKKFNNFSVRIRKLIVGKSNKKIKLIRMKENKLTLVVIYNDIIYFCNSNSVLTAAY